MAFFKTKRIFMDYAAGKDNPSAIYKEGVETKKRLEGARMKIARVLGVQARDIIFTSGGTEADNLAMLGVSGSHFVTSEFFEHPAILESAKEIERRGGEVTIVQSENGIVSAQKVFEAIRPETALVSIMYANNETGAIQPIHKIARLIGSNKKLYFHTDASQASESLTLNVSSLGVDMMTLDGAKLGVKGVGVLVARPPVNLRPLIFGGGQERGLRAGTEHVSAIVEFANALESAQANREKESVRLEKLKKTFIDEIRRSLPEAVVNTPEESLPNIVSLSFPGKLHEFLAIKLDQKGICVSTGSSCASSKGEMEKEALRFSFGKETNEKDILRAVQILKTIC